MDIFSQEILREFWYSFGSGIWWLGDHTSTSKGHQRKELMNILSQEILKFFMKYLGQNTHFWNSFFAILWIKSPLSILIFQSKCRIDFVTLLAPAAKLLGTESSEELLLPAFQRYMSDSSDVQNALLSQLFTFCKV